MKTNKAVTIKWSILLLVTLLIAISQTTEVFTSQIKVFLCITVFCIGLIALELFPNPMIPSILMMFGYRTICPAATVMSGFANDTLWIVICIFIIINVLTRIGLLNRLAYGLLSKMGGSFVGICAALYLVGLVLSLLGDSAVLAMIAISFGIVSALKLEKTRAGIGIMMAGYAGVIDAGLFVYNPASCAWIYSMAKAGSDLVGTAVAYPEWFKFGAIFILHWIAMFFVIIALYRPKEGLAVNGQEYFREKNEELGKMTGEEKKIIVILVVMFIYLFTVNFHNQPMSYGFVAAVFLMFLPGIGAGRVEDIKNVNFAFPMFIAACLAIGSVCSYLGLGQLLVDSLMPIFSGTNLVTFFFLIAVVVFLLNKIMTPGAILGAFVTPMAAVAMSLPGVHNVFPLVAAVWLGISNCLLPHETSNNVVLFSFNTMTMKDHIKAFGIRSIVYYCFFLVAFLYWRAIGLIG